MDQSSRKDAYLEKAFHAVDCKIDGGWQLSEAISQDMTSTRASKSILEFLYNDSFWADIQEMECERTSSF